MDCLWQIIESCRQVPLPLLALFFLSTAFGVCVLLYAIILVTAPIPRAPTTAEKSFKFVQNDGTISTLKQLPCWQDTYVAQKTAVQTAGDATVSKLEMEPAEIFMSVVVPAYNEENRLGIMLTEAVEYLEAEYGTGHAKSQTKGTAKGTPNGTSKGNRRSGKPDLSMEPRGWEILLVSDGSTDGTIEIALNHARTLGPDTAACIRVISLEKNRGKGGAVTHGMRHVRGKYAIFADADGASKFQDLGKLVQACQSIEDEQGRAVAVGSRAHLVGSEAVVKRSWLRNFLMHSFHLLLRVLTPPATAAIQDTQCGFKLFSRPALPHIIPYMHSEGWIFDVEMLMLAESARIPVAEVHVGWKEIQGSKLNVVWDSLGMAWGLAVLRAAWTVGVYSRRS